MTKQTREAQFALLVSVPPKTVILYVQHPTRESEKLERILKSLAFKFPGKLGDLPSSDIPHLFTQEIAKLSSLSYKVVHLKRKYLHF